jgi:hypothetical protein
MPTIAARLHALLRRFALVWATHRPLTVRPGRSWVTEKLTVAGSLRAKEKLVPIGGLRRLIFASVLPSRK